MAMAVTMDNTLALTVSADHLVGRYDLTVQFFLFRNLPALFDPLLLRSRSLAPMKQVAQPIELSTPVMLQSQSAVTAKCAQSEDGMESMFSLLSRFPVTL